MDIIIESFSEEQVYNDKREIQVIRVLSEAPLP